MKWYKPLACLESADIFYLLYIVSQEAALFETRNLRLQKGKNTRFFDGWSQLSKKTGSDWENP